VTQQAGNIMSMAINRVSASGVSSTLYAYQVTKPSRVANVTTDRTPAAATTQAAVQPTSRQAPSADTSSSTAAQAHASFEYAKAALGNLSTAVAVTQPSPNQEQAGVVQQASSAYAQVEQQAGQVLDITA
jgi:hypothetical protein